jgi:phosphohistidine phosphatase
MHQLILLRHAKAAPEAPGLSDHERPLTEAGRRAATAIGQAMRKSGLTPDVVLVSSALRTQETFAALEAAGVWDEWPNMDSVPTLYMATGYQIRDTLRELNETVRSALVIGHNPGLHELAVALAGPANPRPELARLQEGYPTAALTEFLVTTTWRRLGSGASSLQRFLQATDIV